MRPKTSHPGVALGLILVFAGCASQSGPQPAANPESGTNYFVGVESEFSRALSSLPTDERLPPSSVMHEALIAGDGEVFVTATLYRAGAHVAMDMIVLNHSEDAVELSRNEVRLVDSSGRFFENVDDFDGAESFGLRSKRARQPSAPLYSGPVDVRMPEPYQRMAALETREQKGVPPQATNSAPQRDPLRDIQPMPSVGSVVPNAPAVMYVAPQQGRAYWVYWSQVEEPVFPLTAFVMLGDRHVQFQFDQPMPQ